VQLASVRDRLLSLEQKTCFTNVGKSAVNKIGRWVPAIAWMMLIFGLSAQSQLPTPEERWVEFVLEKSGHFLMFAVLAALLVRALDPKKLGRRRAFGLAIFIAVLYGLSDEIHQVFVPGRKADWTDVLVDWAGAVFGSIVWLNWWTTRRSQFPSRGV
jgi:VanZ family protein